MMIDQERTPRMRPGLTLIDDHPGHGPLVERGERYRVRLRMWLHRGDPVRWPAPPEGDNTTEDDGRALVMTIRWTRDAMIAGLLHGAADLRVGGRRRLRIAPHLAYGERGVPGRIPRNALLEAEIEILAHCSADD